MELRKFGDGTNNIVDQHDVDRYGLRVLVSRSLEVMAGWRSAADVAAAGLLVIFVILAFAVLR